MARRSVFSGAEVRELVRPGLLEAAGWFDPVWHGAERTGPEEEPFSWLSRAELRNYRAALRPDRLGGGEKLLVLFVERRASVPFPGVFGYFLALQNCASHPSLLLPNK